MSKRLDYNQIAPAGLKALGGGHGYVAQSSLPAQLSQIVQRVRDGRLRTNIGNLATLDDAVAAFNRTERRKGKTIIRVRSEKNQQELGDARAPFSTAIVGQRGSAPRDHVAR